MLIHREITFRGKSPTVETRTPGTQDPNQTEVTHLWSESDQHENTVNPIVDIDVVYTFQFDGAIPKSIVLPKDFLMVDGQPFFEREISFGYRMVGEYWPYVL